jgi:hypothetical protein
MAELYQVAGEGANQHLTATAHSGVYDPKITKEIDQKIRHMPQVVRYITQMAQLLKIRAGTNFEVIVSTKGKSRPRAYVAPKNSDGIKEELKDGVLLKAALGMRGK